MQENKHKYSRVVRYSKYLFVWKGRIQFQASHGVYSKYLFVWKGRIQFQVSNGVFVDNSLDSRTSLFQPGEFDAGASTKLSKIT